MDATDEGARTRLVCDKFRLFRICRLIGVDQALTEEMQHYIGLYAAWIDSDTWEDGQAFLRQHPILLSDTGREVLRVMVEMQISESEATTVTEHLDLLDQCRETGIDAAFHKKFAALDAQRLDLLVGLIRKLVSSSSSAEWIDHLSRHPVLLGADGSETWLMGWERVPEKVTQVVQQYLRSRAEDAQLSPFELSKLRAMQDFLQRASFVGDRLTYPRDHALLNHLDAGCLPEMSEKLEDGNALLSSASPAAAAADCAAILPGRAAYFAGRRSHGAPTGTLVADFMGLSECKRLGSGGRSMLYIGGNAESALTVAKFYPAVGEDGPAAYERDEARLMYAANYGPSRWCVLPIESHVNQITCPEDAASIGWAYTTPWCALGSLRDRVNFGRLDTYERVLLLLNMAICLRGLHEAHIVHGDVKPDNFLFWEPGDATPKHGPSPLLRAHLVLSDLGSSAYLRNPALRRDRSGTPDYQPPESLRGAPPAFSNDIWAWGAVATELFTGAPNAGAATQASTEAHAPQILQIAGCPTWLSDLVQACQASLPAARPSFADIVSRFAEHCDVRVDASALLGPVLRDFVFRLDDLPTETIEHCPELLTTNTTPLCTVVSSAGIFDTLRTVEALLRDNRHESFVEAFHIIHKRFACDGGRGSLMWQLWADPDADTYVNPPTRPLGPNEVMGLRSPIPSAHAYMALEMYLTAIVLVRQHCLDPQADEEGLRLVEFFGFDQVGCTVAGRLEATTMLSLLILFGSEQGRSPYLTAVWAQLEDDAPNKVANAAELLSHCLLADGDVTRATMAMAIATNSLLHTQEEKAWQCAISATVLCALEDNVELLSQIVGKLKGSPIWDTLQSTDLWQLSTRYLDCGLQQHAEPLLPMRDLLLGGRFFVKGVTVGRLWLGCACLWRMGERETATRIAGVLVHDQRLSLPFNRPFAQALQRLMSMSA